MTKYGRKFSILTMILSCFTAGCLFFSCTPKIEVSIYDENSTQVKVENTGSKELNSVLETFSPQSENKNGKPQLFDSEGIKLQLAQRGFKDSSVSVKNYCDISIASKGNLKQLNELLRDFVSIKKAAGETQLTLEVSPQIILAAQSIAPESQDYIDLLMAPCVTGENLSEQEYLEILSSLYGKKAVEKFSASNFEIVIKTPSRIKNFSASKNSIGKMSVNTNECHISIPICKYLCSKSSYSFTVQF